MISFSQTVKAITFEQYIADHDSPEMRSYLTGYADAIHNNAYLLGACPRKLPYRPYGEYFQHIDLYITKKTKDTKKNLTDFYNEPVEPFLTAVILKYTDCSNSEARLLQNEPKNIQIEIRNLARDIMAQTKKYQTPQEMEIDFAYKQHIDRLDNPEKYEKKCPTTKKKPHHKPKKTLQNAEINTIKPEIIDIEVKNSTKSQETSPKQKKADVEKYSTEKPQIVEKTPEDTSQKTPENTLKEPSLPENIEKKNTTNTQEITPKAKYLENQQQNEKISKMKEIEHIPSIPEPKNTKKNPKDINIADVKAKKYELDSIKINLQNLNDIKLSDEDEDIK